MGSTHDHSPGAIPAPRKRLLAVLLITAVILVVGVIGAIRSGSLALLAVTLAARKAGPDRTFGNYRLEAPPGGGRHIDGSLARSGPHRGPRTVTFRARSAALDPGAPEVL